MKLKMTACIEAPEEKVWEILANITNVHLWIDPVISATCEDGKLAVLEQFEPAI